MARIDEQTWRQGVGLLLVLCAVALCSACSKSEEGASKSEKDDTTPQLDGAVTALADAVEARFAADGAFPDTGYLVYCRGGRSVIEADEFFSGLGFQLPGELKNIDLCYARSDDGKKVALGARARPDAETSRCLKLEASSGRPTRSAISDEQSCTP